MNRPGWLLLWFLTLSVPACSSAPPPAPEPSPAKGLQWQAMARKITERLAPKPGERILLAVKGARFSELVSPLREAISRQGAEDLGSHDVDGPALTDEEYSEILQDVDALVILPGPEPADKLYSTMQDILRHGRGRTIHFHWEGAMAMPGGSLPPQDLIDAKYQQALLETDYQALNRAQVGFEEAMRKNEVRVTTPAGTDIRFRIGDRRVTKQNGDASAANTDQGVVLIDREIELPSGAIRVAPLEESVQGEIVFPDAEWDGKSLGPVRLHFEDGKVTDIQSDDNNAVAAELDSNPAARYFREFALGFNPLLAIPSENPWIPYYGYGAGVVRLSLGDNSELGGTITGGYVRWNFFTDATVTVGDDVWVREGQLIR